MTADQALARLDSDFPRHLARVQEFLRIPSVADSPALDTAARWLEGAVTRLGATVERCGDMTKPTIVAHLDARAGRTLLVYGMYDVHGVEGQVWSSPPFAAEIRELPDIGAVVVARGACNSKGPLAAFLNAVDSCIAARALPVNLTFLIEGEEESGSPSLQRVLEEKKADLPRADAGFEPFWATYGTDVVEPILSLGTKGVVGLRLTCRGGSWGGPRSRDVHSSVGAWIGSPVWRLLSALASMVGKNEELRIKELVTGAPKPSPGDEDLLQALAARFDAEKTLELAGAQRFKTDLHGVDLLRSYLFLPTVQVTSFGPLSGDVIPPELRAELLVRLVPGVLPEEAEDAVRAHLVRAGFGDIVVEKLVGYPGSRTDLASPVVQALLRSYRDLGQEPQIWPFLASATPYYVFREKLGIPYVVGGLGQAGRSHAADEFATIDGIRDFERSIVLFLHHFAALSSSDMLTATRD